ncbi:unnamed protein product, partial [marine sediment metagenome]
LTKKYMLLKEEKVKASETPRTDSLKRTQIEAQKLIDEASQKAQEIIRNTKTFTDKSTNLLTQEIQNATQNYAVLYGETLRRIQDESVKIVATIPNDVKESVINELTSLRSILQDELKRSQEEARKIIGQVYKEVETEIENYKEKRMKQLDDSILEIVEQVSRKVLAKEISLEEHEKLVMKALEEAKRQEIF